VFFLFHFSQVGICDSIRRDKMHCLRSYLHPCVRRKSNICL